MLDIERFSDRYREKQTDEGLDWQPGNISVLLIYYIIYLTLKGVPQQNMFYRLIYLSENKISHP